MKHLDPKVEQLICHAERQLAAMRRQAGGTLRLQAFNVQDTMKMVIDHVEKERK